MTEQGTRRSAGARSQRAGVRVLTFVAGVVVGTGLTALLVIQGVFGQVADALPGETPAPTVAADVPAGAAGDVPASCLQAAEYNDTVNASLDEIAVAVADQEARRLAEALDAVQDGRPEGEAASAECQRLAGGAAAAEGAGSDDAGTEDAEDDGAAPEPTEEPTEEPTDEPSASPTATDEP